VTAALAASSTSWRLLSSKTTDVVITVAVVVYEVTVRVVVPIITVVEYTVLQKMSHGALSGNIKGGTNEIGVVVATVLATF
jgi:hypothetical protein